MVEKLPPDLVDKVVEILGLLASYAIGWISRHLLQSNKNKKTNG